MKKIEMALFTLLVAGITAFGQPAFPTNTPPWTNGTPTNVAPQIRYGGLYPSTNLCVSLLVIVPNWQTNSGIIYDADVYMVSNLVIGVPFNAWTIDTNLTSDRVSSNTGWYVDLHMDNPYYYEIITDLVPQGQTNKFWWAEQGDALTNR